MELSVGPAAGDTETIVLGITPCAGNAILPIAQTYPYEQSPKVCPKMCPQQPKENPSYPTRNYNEVTLNLL